MYFQIIWCFNFLISSAFQTGLIFLIFFCNLFFDFYLISSFIFYIIHCVSGTLVLSSITYCSFFPSTFSQLYFLFFLNLHFSFYICYYSFSFLSFIFFKTFINSFLFCFHNPFISAIPFFLSYSTWPLYFTFLKSNKSCHHTKPQILPSGKPFFFF